MSKNLKLDQVAFYSKERIHSDDVSLENFVTVDNLLPNKGGLVMAGNMPPQGGSLPKYKKESILVGNIRPYLKKIWFADRDGGASADVLVFDVKPEYCPKYVYYAMFRDDFFAHMMRGKKGTKMPRGDKDQILDFLIPDNTITEQQKIAAVFAALDKKIELNIRINAELESMARTLYEYWFVQFDFSDKSGKPYKTSGGKMVWNAELKREIPEGWAVKKLVDWISTDKSGDWGNDEPKGDYTCKVTCIRGTDINGLNGTDFCNPPTRFILQKNSHKILNSHDLIIEISGGAPTQSTGRLGYVTDATLKRFENPLICSNFCKAISLKNKKHLYNFIYYWSMLYDNDIFFGQEGKTSGIKNLLFDSFVKSHWIVEPKSELIEEFYSFMQNIQKKKQAVLCESQVLMQIRDWLLPMLMNGQVKVN